MTPRDDYDRGFRVYLWIAIPSLILIAVGVIGKIVSGT
jgi:hypothetical protein